VTNKQAGKVAIPQFSVTPRVLLLQSIKWLSNENYFSYAVDTSVCGRVTAVHRST